MGDFDSNITQIHVQCIKEMAEPAYARDPCFRGTPMHQGAQCPEEKGPRRGLVFLQEKGPRKCKASHSVGTQTAAPPNNGALSGQTAEYGSFQRDLGHARQNLRCASVQPQCHLS
jgi:hypothetical protein